jgi:hypothetical protein
MMLKKILLISLVIVVIALLVSPDSFDFFGKIPDEGKKITRELTDPPQESADTFADNIQKAFAFVGGKIEGLVFSADIFLSKQENKTSQPLEEVGFFGKIDGKNSDKPTTSTGTGGGGTKPNNNGNASPAGSQPTQNPTNVLPTTTIPFDTLSLITSKQSDNRVSMKYDDTSRKTINVTVQIRNENSILFSGQYFSSSFETAIMDASATPHFIDLLVEHQVYGQVTATAFVPAGSSDAVIYGVFSKN